MYACQYVNRSICSNFKYLTGKYQQMTTLIVTMPFCGICEHFIEDSIPVGCVPPACQPHVFRWLPLDVSPAGGGELGIPIDHTYPLDIPTLQPLDIPTPRYLPPWIPTPTPWRELVPEIPTPQKGPGTRDTYPYPIPKQIDRHLWKH